MNFDKSVIDPHEQRYSTSCIPSAVEMVLKLLGKVDINYYDLQEAWKNKHGSFADFNGKTLEGLTFETKFSLPRGKNFPIQELFDTIDGEIASGRYVIISVACQGGWHMYIIYDKAGDEYLALSKDGRNTIFMNDVKARVRSMGGTDILVYRT